MPDNEQTEQWQMPDEIEKNMVAFIEKAFDPFNLIQVWILIRHYNGLLHTAGLLVDEAEQKRIEKYHFDLMNLDKKQICEKYHFQCCSDCPDFDCCDNTNPIKSRIIDLEAYLHTIWSDTLDRQKGKTYCFVPKEVPGLVQKRIAWLEGKIKASQDYFGDVAVVQEQLDAIQERARELLSTTPELGNYGLLNVAKFLRDDLVSGTFAEKGKNKVPDIVKCGWCGYEGRGERTTSDNGLSAPWCRKCGKNDKLTPVVSGAFTGRDTDAE